MQEEVSPQDAKENPDFSLHWEKTLYFSPSPIINQNSIFPNLCLSQPHISVVQWKSDVHKEKNSHFQVEFWHSNIKQTRCKQPAHVHTQHCFSTNKDGKGPSKLKVLSLIALACTLVTANCCQLWLLLGADSWHLSKQWHNRAPV